MDSTYSNNKNTINTRNLNSNPSWWFMSDHWWLPSYSEQYGQYTGPPSSTFLHPRSSPGHESHQTNSSVSSFLQHRQIDQKIQVLHYIRIGDSIPTKATLYYPASLSIFEYVVRRCIAILQFQGQEHGAVRTRTYLALEKTPRVDRGAFDAPQEGRTGHRNYRLSKNWYPYVW